jgi:hypothetical protein
VPAGYAQMAIQWCQYLESHARRIYALAQNPSLAAALAFAQKIQDPLVPLYDWSENGFTARDLERRHWTGLDHPTLINSAVARLEECHWIRASRNATSQSGGRPTIRYEINPAILAKRAEKRGFVTTPNICIYKSAFGDKTPSFKGKNSNSSIPLSDKTSCLQYP